jgi:HEAT repeat protein
LKSKPLKKASIHELEVMYEEAAALHGQASREGSHRVANAQHKRILAVWKELRERGETGRVALVRLMGSSNPHVRAWAASHVLEFDPRSAEAELERLANGPPSIVRLDAEMTLKEWRAGHLKFTES